MKYINTIFLSLLITTAVIAREYEEQESVDNTYQFKGTGKTKTLIIKNWRGDVTVQGHKKNTVDVEIKKTIWARSPEQLDKAKQEVKLDVLEEEDLIELFVDGPFRENNRNWQERYKVTYQFNVKVPFETAVDLETVNNGEILITDVHGKCSANNINGPIEASGIRDIGRIYALNKDVQIRFDRNPEEDGTVGSLNGNVRLSCKSDLSADFHIETFNGEVYSNFEYERLKGEPFVESELHGRHIYKAGHKDKIRIGKGGPLIKWEGFNGDLLILNQSLKKNASL